MRRRTAIVAAVVGLGLILGWPTVAFAYDPNAIGITTSGCSVPGGSLTVNGTNFQPNESITLTLQGTTLGTPTADPTGSFGPTKVMIPPDTTPGDSYTIVATGTSGDSSSTGADIATSCGTASGLAFTGGAGSGSGLAFTGADIAAMSSVGAIALAVGGMLILTARRRRTSGV